MSKSPSVSRPVLVSLLMLALLLPIGGAGLSGCQWWPPAGGPGLVEEPPSPRDIVTVFFSRGQDSSGQVANVLRPIPGDAREEPLRFALDELLKGPRPEEKSKGFYTEIPPGTRLLSLKRSNGAITVNLSRQFVSGGGSTSMTQRVEEIKRTVYSVDRRHQLNLAIEGKPLEVLGGEGLEVHDVLKRDAQ
jgi:spore germination protein GerM